MPPVSTGVFVGGPADGLPCSDDGLAVVIPVGEDGCWASIGEHACWFAQYEPHYRGLMYAGRVPKKL